VRHAIVLPQWPTQLIHYSVGVWFIDDDPSAYTTSALPVVIEVMPMPDFRRQDRSVSLHASESLVRRTHDEAWWIAATEKDWNPHRSATGDDRSGQVETCGIKCRTGGLPNVIAGTRRDVEL